MDIVDWQCGDTALIDNIIFSSRGIENFKAAEQQVCFDIICFPKSISDIPASMIFDFANSLKDNDLQDKLCVIVSKRGVSTTDSDVGRQFVEILSENLSYAVSKEERDDILTSDAEYFESHLDHPFVFDNSIGYFLQALGERCYECDCDYKKKCKDIVGKWPMRWITNISPEIYYLEKN